MVLKKARSFPSKETSPLQKNEGENADGQKKQVFTTVFFVFSKL